MRRLLVLVSLVLLATMSLAQTPTGTFEGTVTDPQGAAIAGVTVSVTNVATGIEKTTTTNREGQYVLPYLPPSTYRVTVKAAGFRPAAQENVLLEVTQTRSLDFTLRVGAATEAIEVLATSPVLDTQTSSLGEVIQTHTVNDLPLNGRNPFALAQLTPTVYDDKGGPSIPHIGGSRDSTNEEQIDGMTNILPENNVGDNNSAYNPIVDSVQEFSVQTNSLSAEYGRYAGGTISLITKSGGERFHGSGFLFARNGVLDAASYFGKSSDPKPFHRYQSGGSIGGQVPLFKNGSHRTFFFFAYENSQESNAAQETDLVPLPQWFTGTTAGDFSALIPAGTDCNVTKVAGCIYDPLTIDTTTHQRQAFPGNIIPQDRLNPTALAMLAFYPAPNASGNGTNYSIVGATPHTYSHWDAKLDHDFTPKWHAFLRVSHEDGHQSDLSDYGNVGSQGYGGVSHDTAWTGALNNTFTITPTLLGELRYGVTRAGFRRTGSGGNFDPTTLGFPSYVSETAGPQGQIFPRLNVNAGGFAGLGPNGFNAFSQNPFAHDITGSIVKIAGTHSIKFGGEFRKLYENFYQFGLPTGQYNLDNSWTQSTDQTVSADGTGQPFAGFLLGLANGGNTWHTPSGASSSGYIATFIQDDWKATRHLTLNLGLRWDLEIPKTERYNKLSYWDGTLPSPLQGQVVVPAGVDCPNCDNLFGQMVFVGTPGAKYGRRQAPTQKKDFAPRLGLSYDAGHKLVFRGGFGLVYAPSALQAAGTSGGVGNEGFQSTTNFAGSFDNEQTIHATLSDPYPQDPVTGARYNLPLGAAGGASTDIGSGISDSNYNSVRNPYNIQWNFNVQYALPSQTTLEIGYLGNHGLFLIDGDPGQSFDQLPTADLALGNALLTQVQNPFFGLITTPGSGLAQPMISANQLLGKFPQYFNVQSFRKPVAESKYNAMTIRINRHFSNGLSLLGSFAWAKETDNSAAPVTFIGAVSSTRMDQYNPRAEWAVGPQDVARNFVAGYVYELPFGRGKKFLNSGGVVNRVLGGWQANGIIRWATGTPVVLGADNVNTTGINTPFGQRPLWNGQSAQLGSGQSHTEWFNTSVFSQRPLFTLGNAPRTLSNVRNPGVSNSDLSFFKNNFFGGEDRYNLQFRADMFNAFNHARWGAPDTNVNDGSNFGKITSVINSQRQIQLAVKFVF